MTPERYEQVAELYHAALERAPGERAAFLAEACGPDEALRREVASLLVSHEQAESFIERQPDDVAAGWQLAACPPRRFAHYSMVSQLGEGGMGEVWLAQDDRLGRQVAVKLLPAEFTTDAGRVRRFAREARAASALNHPNIVTIHDIGEIPTEIGGLHYIVTEYVGGETLRQRLTGATQNRLSVVEALDIAAQVAAALDAAHEAGIVHRDIKPENVMVRPDGIVKVLDFGLAKLTEPARPVAGAQAAAATMSTGAGLVMGTPQYISPEQARGENVDARTDLFSLGVMLYEMVAGRPAFAGTTPGELIAAILRDEPPPLAEFVANAPPELERIIRTAICKDLTHRYQTSKDLLADLKELQHRMKLGRPAFEVSLAGGASKSASKRWAIIAAVALSATALAAWFYFKRAPALTEKDTVLLADFENKTGDEIFDAILKQGLAIQLEQSPFLSLFPEAQVRHELTLMKRAPGERVTAELAREICVRQNLKALIAGSIVPLGRHYVITLEAVNGASGETLAREQVQAGDKEQVLRALSEAATRLRERLGESLGSIQRFNRPLQEGTTAKPEAFKAYSQAIELAVGGRLREAIPFYKRAVEIDPDFAHSYSQLAIMYWVTGQLGLAAEYATQSYVLKDRAGELERFRITHKYYLMGPGDVHKAIEVLRLQRRTYPREWTGPNDLALALHLIGQTDQAISEARESIRLNPSFAAPYNHLAAGLLRLNRFAEAKDVIAQAVQRGLDHRDFHLLLYQVAFIGGDTSAMQQQIDWAGGKPEEHAALAWQTGAAAFGGQWRKAQELSRRAVDMAVGGDMPEVAARYATDQATRGAVLGDCRQARVDAGQGLKLALGRESLPRAALALALCGETKQVKPLVEDLTRRYPADTVIHSLWLPAIGAAMDLRGGNPSSAMRELQTTSRYEVAAEFWPQYLRGLAYLDLGRGSEAAAEFQEILRHRSYGPLSLLYPLAHLGLARASATAGEMPKSRIAYGDFLASWKDADNALPAIIEAKKEYAKR